MSANQIGRLLITTLLFALPVGVALAADPKPPEPLKTVTYDVAEFVTGARPDDQPDPSPAVLTADMPIGSPPSLNRTQAREHFVSFMKETIDPRSWQPTGPGSIALEGDRLVVNQTAANHRAIANLFRQLREAPDERKLLESFVSAPRLPQGTRFDHTEFATAVAAIGKAASVPIEVEYDSLARSNVEFDTPVTADVSGQTPAAALRTLVRAASGLRPHVQISAARKSITLAIDAPKEGQKQSRGFDIRRLPARSSGLDFAKPHPRKEVVDALIQRVEKEFNLKGVHESGLLIASGPAKTLAELGRYLNDLEDGQQP
jgi:hypothetical protein